jgi:hypothetical protein
MVVVNEGYTSLSFVLKYLQKWLLFPMLGVKKQQWSLMNYFLYSVLPTAQIKYNCEKFLLWATME